MNGKMQETSQNLGEKKKPLAIKGARINQDKTHGICL